MSTFVTKNVEVDGSAELPSRINVYVFATPTIINVMHASGWSSFTKTTSPGRQEVTEIL